MENSKTRLKRSLAILWIVIFIDPGCAGSITLTPSAVPALSKTVTFMATNVSQPTITLVVTSHMPAVPTATTPADLLAAAQTVVTAIETNQPEMLRLLIDEEGVAPGGFAQGVNLKGYNNADEIVAAFDEALNQSIPICEGFVPNAGTLPDKATFVYRGMEFDWSQYGLSGTNSGGMTLTLFKLSEGWRLIYITPFDFKLDLPILGPLQECPIVNK
jgi:hypothetical protein